MDNGSGVIVEDWGPDVRLPHYTGTEKLVRAALKSKWQGGDQNVNLSAMATFYGITQDEARAMIQRYEADLLDTKFELT